MNNFIAEFLGTLTLIVLGNGVVGGILLNKSKAKDAGWIVGTLGWGLAVTMAIYAVGQFSGAHINPAVTLGFAMVGEFAWADVPGYIAAQFAGAIAASVLVWLHYLPHWRTTEDADLKLGVFCNAPAIRSRWANLFSEIVGTAVLLLGLLVIGADEFTEGLKPLIVGLLIVAIGFSLGGTTGYAINPARDLGPRIAHFLLPIFGKRDSDWGYSWIPVLGPVIGGLFGATFYYAAFKSEASISFWVLTAVVATVAGLAVWEERKKGK